MTPYDPADKNSIENFAKRLLHKSLRDELGQHIENKYKGKGKLGQALEDLYFKYKPNSNSEPDFPKAGVEVKSSPLKKISKGLTSKERLVLNIIDFEKEHKYTFETSSFWRKNKLLLLMFFLYEKEKIDLDYIFKIIRLWEFPETDLKIIRDDWEKIAQKIRDGRAHELSEGDTLYLGACTKGANRNSLRKQANSTIMAMQRAFSLKSKYLNFIIQDSLASKIDTESVVKNIKTYSKQQTFEELVIEKFKPYYGKTELEILKATGLIKSHSKSKAYLLAKGILGVKAKYIAEFEKADVEMKTVTLEKSGALKESMSFSQIKFMEIINERWEESYWHDTLTKRFFFVIFQKNDKGDLVLKKVMFWTMPFDDLKKAKTFWLDTRDKIRRGDHEHFIKISDNRLCHVRPKGTNKQDKMLAPSGKMEEKRCYWLNAAYTKTIVS